uniref:Uncharacterized protein n=1 Tax=Meloidogyne enterolobii TaxID=390850 RepID=A0A6V7UG64_MELEN|nr:unnamed protein product [Meloidogyne enterolobii]
MSRKILTFLSQISIFRVCCLKTKAIWVFENRPKTHFKLFNYFFFTFSELK